MHPSNIHVGSCSRSLLDLKIQNKMHSSRMHTAHSLLYREGLCPGPFCPGPFCPGGLCMGVSVQEVSVQGVSVQEVSVRDTWRDPLPTVNIMTDTSKNITLPPTLFAGGNKRKILRQHGLSDLLLLCLPELM